MEALPLYVLGAGSVPNKYWTPRQQKIISQANLLTFRTQSLAESAIKIGLNQAKYLPCPALLSANISQQKKWIESSDHKVIGLGYNIPSSYTVNSIGVSEKHINYLHPYSKIL